MKLLPRIVTIGELLWDVFRDGEFLGGSPANVAFHAARLGATPTLVSRVGRDQRGSRATDDMRNAGVDTSGVGVHPRLPTGRVSVTFDEAAQPRFDIKREVAWDDIEFPEHVRDRLDDADIVCLGTLPLRAVPTQRRIVEELRRLRRRPLSRRPTIIVDLNLRPPFDEVKPIRQLLGLADVLKLNEQELIWLSHSLDSIKPFEWLFTNTPIRLIALTRGSAGAAFISPRVRTMAPAPRVQGGDPVGAGDAFVATLATELARKTALPRILERANRYAAWVASQRGAMPAGRPLWLR